MMHAWLLLGWLVAAGPETSETTAAEQTCANFELEECVRLNEALLTNPSLDSQKRAAAYQRLASAYAAMEDVAQSSRYWRLLLRLQPDMELPDETSPKILMVFRSVQVEEKRLREELEAERQRQTIERIGLELDVPEEHQGGFPLAIRAELVDPDGGVKSAWLRHRTPGQGEFAALPLARSGGHLQAEFPAAFTAGNQARDLELFVELRGGDGKVLKTVPPRDEPARVHMLAGDVPRTPFWRETPFQRVAIGAVIVGAPLVVTVVLGALAVFGGTTLMTVWLASIQPGLQGSPYQEVP